MSISLSFTFDSSLTLVFSFNYLHFNIPISSSYFQIFTNSNGILLFYISIFSVGKSSLSLFLSLALRFSCTRYLFINLHSLSIYLSIYLSSHRYLFISNIVLKIKYLQSNSLFSLSSLYFYIFCI